MTMRERIADGKLFTDDCEGMPEERRRCKVQMAAFNASSPEDPQERTRIMTELFGREAKAGGGAPVFARTQIQAGRRGRVLTRRFTAAMALISPSEMVLM